MMLRKLAVPVNSSAGHFRRRKSTGQSPAPMPAQHYVAPLAANHASPQMQLARQLRQRDLSSFVFIWARRK
jgi:hypothetical protein